MAILHRACAYFLDYSGNRIVTFSKGFNPSTIMVYLLDVLLVVHGIMIVGIDKLIFEMFAGV